MVILVNNILYVSLTVIKIVSNPVNILSILYLIIHLIEIFNKK